MAAVGLDFTPDGKKILFYTNVPFRQKTLDIETGEQHDLGLEHSQDLIGSVRFSPDQNWVSFKLVTWEAPVFVSRIIGGVAQEQSSWVYIGDSPAGGVTWWSPDGNTLYAQDARDGVRCIWACSLDPATKEPLGPFEEVQHFHGNLRHLGLSPATFGYGLTGDKHYMALAESRANIWLAEPQPSQED